MISNRDFIKTQAYEISWAVFRCAELFSQSKLREEIESAAIDLVAERPFVSDAAEGDSPRIEKLTSLIRLAESVGQIATINANVLYRELDNLSRAIRIDIAEKQKKGDITTSLEQIFTNPAYAEGLRSSPVIPAKAGIQSATAPAVNSASVLSVIPAEAGIQHSQKQAVAANPVIRQNNASQFGSIESLLSAAALPNKSANREVNPTNVPAPVGSWQHVILQKVKDLGQTTTKELTASFPEISERTIRFYLQKLVDNGAIDRIGSTGPGSAYKAK